jgi:hypothetical protein
LLVSLWTGTASARYGNLGFSVGFAFGSSDEEFLGTYGTWTDVAPYGQVWVPSVATSWQPFEYGRWIWTDDGWAWSSYEPYGWLVYHYGHWNYRSDLGWYWIPSDVWSPAPVVWSTFGNYVCWAPAPFSGAYWPEPWDSGPVFNFWVGVRLGDFDRDDVGSFRVHEFPRGEIPAREHIFSGPPNIVLAQRYAHHPIQTERIQRERVNWPNRNYDRMIPPQSQQRYIQRWQQDHQGRVYMPRSAPPPEQRSQNENRGSSRGDQGQGQNRGGESNGGESHGGESHGGGHNNGGGHGEHGGDRGR